MQAMTTDVQSRTTSIFLGGGPQCLFSRSRNSSWNSGGQDCASSAYGGGWYCGLDGRLSASTVSLEA